MPIEAFDQRTVPNSWIEADEGRYFVATNPTMGTGIAMGIQTSFSDTANVLCNIFNNAGTATTRIYLDYIRLIVTAAGSTTTASDLAIKLDSSGATRVSSGGSSLTPVSVLPGYDGKNSIAQVTFGAITGTTAVNSNAVARIKLKTQTAPCWTVGDSVLIKFGVLDGQGFGNTSGSATLNIGLSAAPIIITPGGNCLFHMWNTANATTPPSFEVELGWWER